MEKETSWKIIIFAALVLLVLSLVYRSKSEIKYFQSVSQNIVLPRTTSVLFVGDIMLDRMVRQIIDSNGFESIVESIQPLFANLDMAVGNLEGTVTANTSLSAKNYKILRFTFASTTLPALKSLGFNVLGLANNHALDFGADGYDETVKNLEAAGISFFGSPLNNKNLSTKVRVNDEDMCFIGFHALYNPDVSTVLDEINKVKDGCSFLVVFAHWGVEYNQKVTNAQRVSAHQFIDVGADLVLGAHPHVIEPVEVYKDKAIFYSLGNFIFDQNFSLATRQGLAVRMELSKSKVDYHLIGIQMDRDHLVFPEKEAFQPETNILISELSEALKQTVDIDSVLELSR
ncbi:CapA family protein [Candidatus Parcubacteria bacterium]|nr:CapA family protein [Candidatus Parcubacteria bacterium]